MVMSANDGRKKTMILSSRPDLDRMETQLVKAGCTVHCADWDGNWFIIYSDPEPVKA